MYSISKAKIDLPILKIVQTRHSPVFTFPPKMGIQFFPKQELIISVYLCIGHLMTILQH